VGGIFTNFDQIKRRLSKLEDLKRKREKGELAKYTKKEQLLISREIEDLEARFGGIADMRELPGAIFVIDPKHERIAVAEANKRNIPVVSLMNTDCDSSYVDYPIYGNDAARPSIAFFVEEIASAYRDTAKKS
jgi:small subunit ribosomal protein S2